jgi:UDP:flavonoid glycosyltransferase YjiC (YdhE family)
LARGLKAGIPQVILPIAMDGFDNADRLAQLGAAKSIARTQVSGQKVATELSELLHSQTVLERCRHYAAKFEYSTAPESTCNYIEALM